MLLTFPQKGWRRTGVFNIALSYMGAVVLLICLSISITQPGSSLSVATIIFEGDCAKSSRINTTLHLLLNILSTLILASSNYFMQLLSSPSRHEIDQAHAWLRSLDIGVPSIHNLRYVSPFKQIGWVVLLISSIPIHLFFNSAIFETTYQGSHWHLTVATDAFFRGADFFQPGASLAPAGATSILSIYNETSQNYINASSGNAIGGFGKAVSLGDYWNRSSDIRQRISNIASEASSWTPLDIEACQNEYRSCNPRVKYGNVIVVVQGSYQNPTGWTRSEVFHFDPASNFSSLWDSHIPPTQVNSLWYTTECKTTRTQISIKNHGTCTNTCLKALGAREYSYSPEDVILPLNPWLLSLDSESTGEEQVMEDIGYNTTFNNLKVNYCQAQPIPEQCKVGLSNALLLVVISCVLVKAVACSFIAWKLPAESLVHLGDAIQSFITTPDPITKGLGTLDIENSQQLEFGYRKRWTPHDDSELTSDIRPRQWNKTQRRLMSIIPNSVWLPKLALFFAALILLSAGLGATAESSGNNFDIDLSHPDNLVTQIGGSNLGYIGALLFANTPQLLLSLCYFSYNSLITRLCIELEWNSFSLSYKPLRVSYSTGDQISTYRLELPYKFSIPLIGISILLHWLLSNAIYLFVFDGGYLEASGLTGIEDQFRVSDESLISLGYSPSAMLILYVTSIAAISLPILFSLQRLKGNMVAGGSNSLVVSAACHVPDRITIRRNANHASGDTDTLDNWMNPPLEEIELKTHSELLRKVSKSKVRWGAVYLPNDLSEILPTYANRTILHLSFGGEELDVQEPKESNYYM